MNPLRSAKELHEQLAEPDLVLLDAGLSSTAEGHTADLTTTIPGARYFDLKKHFSDPYSPFPNTLPPPEQFEAECRKLGINKTSRIVVFDNLGVYSSPRVWWMFKVMGHDEISVLDGGLPEWINSGFPIIKRMPETWEAGDFVADFQPRLVLSYEEMLQNVASRNFLVVDARSRGRFSGTEPEPRKHLQSGHIPRSVNLPYQDVLRDGKFRPAEELRAMFEKACSAPEELVFSCGSGLTACIIMLAGEIGFRESKRIYDGSWTEWAERQNLTC